ncbi:MAG: hypothetical protein IJG68_02260 [Bacilli bacterium]|nr:hypothetical protein [Bacilli bacterium]
MEFIKKYKSIIVASLVLVAIVAAIFIVKDTIMFDEYQALYGNRLEGIDKVKVTEKQEKQIKESVKNYTKKIDIRVSGRVINILIELHPGTSLDDARGIAGMVLDGLTAEQKAYFDVEAIVNNSEDPDHFPIIGYKHKSRDNFTWTRDR